MEPHIGPFDPHRQIDRYATKGADPTSAQSQTTLEDSPTYETGKDFKMQASWGERIAAGFKIAGLATGSVLSGALALGLLPFTLLGAGLYTKGSIIEGQLDGVYTKQLGPMTAREEADARQASKRQQIAGLCLAAPAFGCLKCLKEISKTRKDVTRFSSLAKSIKNAVSGNSKVELAEKDIKHLSKKSDLLKVKQYINELTPETFVNLNTQDKERLLRVVNTRLQEISQTKKGL